MVGIALDTAPGRYEVLIQGTAAGSGSSDVTIAAASGRLALTVRAKRFDTRNLQVAEQFVNPPAAEGERIAAEARRMADIFAQARPQRLWSGAFVRPVPGQANSSFGRLTTLNDRRGTRHQGADFRAGAGTPVHAPNAGEVVLASDLYFSGNTVILDHGFGLFSLLAHLSRIGVSAGDRVARGDILGDSGATGRVTGPHLHWAVKLGDVSVDPLSLMQAVAPSESAPVVPPPGH